MVSVQPYHRFISNKYSARVASGATMGTKRAEAPCQPSWLENLIRVYASFKHVRQLTS